MKTFRKHLNEELKDKDFREAFIEEKKLIALSLQIHEKREKSGLTQKQVAEKAKITQQQLSKVENGINCNILTFLKVCEALGLEFELHSPVKRQKKLVKIIRL
jgi:transcriptional regulator with XRE-family HTH domain